MSLTSILLYLTIAGLIFLSIDLSNLKKENKSLKKEIEKIKKMMD